MWERRFLLFAFVKMMSPPRQKHACDGFWLRAKPPMHLGYYEMVLTVADLLGYTRKRGKFFASVALCLWRGTVSADRFPGEMHEDG
jgi:hypothetical protein